MDDQRARELLHSERVRVERLLSDAESVVALAKELGVSPGYVNRSYKHGRNFDAGEIRRVFRLLADADLALKGGMLGEDNPPELVMELLVSEIAGEGRMAAARRR